MNNHTVPGFTRVDLGDAPAELQHKIAVKFSQLNLDANILPTKILFYTDGVKLAYRGIGTGIVEDRQTENASQLNSCFGLDCYRTAHSFTARCA